MTAASNGRATLVVAGLSARLMAEAAAREGYDVIALDVFGDVDTRRAARHWQSIGRDDGPLGIDPQRTLEALRAAAADPQVLGWVAGSGFEGQPELLGRGAQLLPLIGTPAETVLRVRDPAGFFGMLDWLGLPHPEVQFDAPDAPLGWLRKEARGTGGWHIRHADDRHPVDATQQPYYQREAAGTPMSALFIANGREARVLGISELIVRPLGAHHPHVYRGAIGPVALPAALAVGLDTTLHTLVAAFGLRGLCSLDFLLDGDHWSLLEINPRPSASVAIHGARTPWMQAHVTACTTGALAEAATTAPPDLAALRGCEIVFARAAVQLTAAQAEALAARDDCHDLPAAGSRHAPGDPLCSVDADGASVAEVRHRLAEKRAALRASLAQT
ncbi:ATP-grasp domain-containing protein [Methylibium sp.]|uniref:ATP-grasp domain-containing protein n=1 Tax=Methylibium sp. TaxID=2067992 RepID=UPI00333F8D7F